MPTLGLHDPRWNIRWLIRRDMPDVLDIEQASFGRPWTEADFVSCLRHRNCIGMVIEEHHSRIVGFMLYELHRTRLRLLDFAVHPLYRRQGAGAAMMWRLKGKLSQQRRSSVDLFVSDENVGMHLFLQAQGFVAVAVERDVGGDDGKTCDAYRFVFRVEWEQPAGRLVG